VYPSLLEVPVPVDVVNVFRVPDATAGIARDGDDPRRCLWCQFGVINAEGARIAEDGGVNGDHGPLLKVEPPATRAGCMDRLNTQPHFTSVRSGSSR